MAKIRRPTQFSRQFGLDPADLEALGALDPVLNADTRLFIDPLLLKKSSALEMSDGAVTSLNAHYGKLVKLLSASTSMGDVPWRAAAGLMRYREIPSTCLGYGVATVRGSGFGRALSEKLLLTASEIVGLGVTDPELFLLLPLIEEGVGPDLISDMTTNIIAPDLAAYTRRVADSLGVPLSDHRLLDQDERLPANPVVPGLPVLLVPRDVLDKLPVASDWSEVAGTASKNRQLRQRVNQHIGELFARSASKPRKAVLRSQALSDRDSVETLLDVVLSTERKPYDFQRDPASALALQRILAAVSDADLADPAPPPDPWSVVQTITECFRRQVELKGLWRLLWKDRRAPHHERNAQLVYFAVADAYCKANNLDLTPEADTGSGKVDFKVSSGYNCRLLVEIKLSTNSKVVDGYVKQLALYKEAEGAMKAQYVVLDIGRMGRKDQKLMAARNRAATAGDPVSDIEFVDGTWKRSASTL